MTRARTATSVIWSTVVFAGAMLGAPACGGSAKAPVAPAPTAMPETANAVEPPPIAETPPPDAPSAGEPQPQVAESQPAPPPVEMETVTVELMTTPYGALVSRDGTAMGRTPLHIEVPKSADPVVLQISLAGYEAQDVVVNPGADTSMTITLKKAKRVRGNGKGKGVGRGFVLS